MPMEVPPVSPHDVSAPCCTCMAKVHYHSSITGAESDVRMRQPAYFVSQVPALER